MAQISVPGAGGHYLVFTVTGDSTTNYAQAFASVVDTAFTNGSLTLNIVNASGTPSTGSTVLNDVLSTSKSSFTPLTGQYTLIDRPAGATVTGSALGHDTILAGYDTASSGSSATYVATGVDNTVTFINGNNTYDGSTVNGGDTITAGVGNDTITTGTQSTTVFGGAGSALISLNDTVGGDMVYLGAGMSSVVAHGMHDTVVAASAGQAIFGGTSASDNLTVAIETSPTLVGAAGAQHDLIAAGNSALNVYDSVGGNSIFGGSGNLLFTGASGGLPVADSIVAGSGTTAIFGFANADITFASTSDAGNLIVVAGTGNETLNGANAGNFTIFGDTTGSVSSTSTFVGSYIGGSDMFSTGSGNQVYVAGTGTDTFELNTVSGAAGPAHITIFNFANSSDLVGFGNDSSNAQSDINSGTVAGGNLTITLSDHTTVTFVGVTTLTGHTIT